MEAKPKTNVHRSITCMGYSWFLLSVGTGWAWIRLSPLDPRYPQAYIFLVTGEPTCRPAFRGAKAESAAEGFAADP
jgi:hypothetical protein